MFWNVLKKLLFWNVSFFLVQWLMVAMASSSPPSLCQRQSISLHFCLFILCFASGFSIFPVMLNNFISFSLISQFALFILKIFSCFSLPWFHVIPVRTANLKTIHASFYLTFPLLLLSSASLLVGHLLTRCGPLSQLLTSLSCTKEMRWKWSCFREDTWFLDLDEYQRGILWAFNAFREGPWN